jgi:hypothetical protein
VCLGGDFVKGQGLMGRQLDRCHRWISTFAPDRMDLVPPV